MVSQSSELNNTYFQILAGEMVSQSSELNNTYFELEPTRFNINVSMKSMELLRHEQTTLNTYNISQLAEGYWPDRLQVNDEEVCNWRCWLTNLGSWLAAVFAGLFYKRYYF